jgi:hypothetical protein
MATINGVVPCTDITVRYSEELPGEVGVWAHSILASHWTRLTAAAARELAAALVAAADTAEGCGDDE